jgi:GTPase SAR1 family protein
LILHCLGRSIWSAMRLSAIAIFITAASDQGVSFPWRRTPLQCRGGGNDNTATGMSPTSSQQSHPGQHISHLEQQGQYQGSPQQSGLPPDLPSYDDPYNRPNTPQLYASSDVSQQRQGEDFYAAGPPPPPQLPGAESLPPGLSNPYYEEEGEDQEPLPFETEGMPEDPNWDTPGSATANGNAGNGDAERNMDLSSFDKDYILRGLARLYRKKILPLELSSRYGHFHSPPLSPSDFAAPPMILLLGQYSVGKTSFVKYLLGRDFPGIRVGPEPTTDRFTAVLWGQQDKVVPGAALCSQQDRPFTGLSPFGNNFLSRMEGAELNAPILRNITIVDTPGILSGQKQRSRNYDYEAVMKWFAERADLVIVMFDAHKLDISDELKAVMELMIPHLDKIRVVLNKADSISTQQLMRVYGALMWSLGKVMNTPEVCRVYMGSFWDAPLQNTEQAELLQREEMDLLHDIMALPQQAVMRRINELVKRARSVKVHAYIIHYLRKQLPYTFGKREKQRRLIGRLESEFLAAARRYGLPKGDFPALEPMRQALYEIKDLSEFPKLDKKLLREMDKVFSQDIPLLLEKARNH